MSNVNTNNWPMNRYKILGRIGQGAHGYVMKAFDKSSSKYVAMKRLSIKAIDEGIPVKIMREMCALRVLNCKYIVELLDVVPNGLGLILIMEYLPISLYDIINDENLMLKPAQSKCYMKMMLNGINYIHNKHIMHRDLKPANLLITNKGLLKIADFGLARIYNENEPHRQYSHQIMTRWYRAPEILYGAKNYTPAVDLWSIGCIYAELYNKKPLFPGETDIEQLAIVLYNLGTPTEDNWPGLTTLPDYNKITFAVSAGVDVGTLLNTNDVEAKNLIRALIQYNFKSRPTAKKALAHPYFHEMPHASSLNDMPKPENIQMLKVEYDFTNFDMLFGEHMKN